MTDGAYIMLDDVVAWAGVALIAVALLADWARQKWRRLRGGRDAMLRRCPKCWYDLSHTEGLRCSECGYQAKRERRLYRPRKRWLVALLGLAITLGGYATRVALAVNQRGWAAAVPTSVLIAATPFMDDLCNTTPALRAQRKYTTTQILCAELYNVRAQPFRMWRWQRSWLADRCLAGDARRPRGTAKWREQYTPMLLALLTSEESYIALGREPSAWYVAAHNDVEIEVRTRNTWPVGVPVYATVRLHRLVNWTTHVVTIGLPESVTPPAAASFLPAFGSVSRDAHEQVVCLGAFGAGAPPTLRVSVAESRLGKWVEISSRNIRAPFRVAGAVENCLSPVRFKPADEALGRLLSPQLGLSRAGDRIEGQLDLWNRWAVSSLDARALERVTLAFFVEISCNGEVVANGRVWYAIEQLQQWAIEQSRIDRSFKALEWQADRMPLSLDAAKQGTWSVRLRPSPETALQNLDSDEYWDGEIELPLEVSMGKWD